MGSDELHRKRSKEREKRKEKIRKLKPSTWLIVCEGEKTEPLYFQELIKKVNKYFDNENKLKVEIHGMGKNTTSLVKSAIDLINNVDLYKTSIIPYGKVFVVFDKDDFSEKEFNKAIKMCLSNGYIPLWSNQAIEYWFLLHFNYIDSKMNRKDYAKKINLYFKKKGFDYKYHKNDANIYKYLNKYGSEEFAVESARKIYLSHKKDLPSKSESCTTVFMLFDEIGKKIEEIE